MCSPRPLRSEVLADDRHAEVRAVLAAELLGQRVPVVARGVGESPGLAEQLLPLLVREPFALPIGARILATVIEESDVVVSLLERLDLAFDEVIELYEVVGQVLGNVEIHESERTARPVGDCHRGAVVRVEACDVRRVGAFCADGD